MNTNDISFSVWMRIPTAVTDWKLVFHRGCCGEVGYGMHIGQTGKPDFSLHSASNGHYQIGNRVDDNIWHLVSMSAIRSSVVSIYIDGILQGTQNISSQSTSISNVRTFEVGYAGTQAYAFSGFIDNLRIYNRAITAEEVSAIYFKEKSRYGL